MNERRTGTGMTAWRRVAGLCVGTVLSASVLVSCTAAADPPPAEVPSSCDELISNQDLYNFNANLAADSAYEPSPLATDIVTEGGISCGWLNASNGIQLAITMIQMGPEEWQDIRAAAAGEHGSTPLTTVDGVITYSDGMGVVQTYISGRWVVIESPGVSAEEDVQVLLRALSTAPD